MSKVTKELSQVKVSGIFEIAGLEFIKFFDQDGETIVVSKDCLFRSSFGKDSNLKKSTVLKRLEEEVLSKLAEAVGMDNICDIKTDLTTLDGLKPYEEMISKISLPTFDFYRANVHIFDEHKVDTWWWLATPDTAQPHYTPSWHLCVSPSGNISNYLYGNYNGVRPFLRFKSSISVSCEE